MQILIGIDRASFGLAKSYNAASTIGAVATHCARWPIVSFSNVSDGNKDGTFRLRNRRSNMPYGDLGVCTSNATCVDCGHYGLSIAVGLPMSGACRYTGLSDT